MKLTNLFGGNTEKKSDKFKVVKGNDLNHFKEYAKEFKERYLVGKLYKSMKNKNGRLVSIVGLRNTGKTVAGLQVLWRLGLEVGLTSCAYIEVREVCEVKELEELILSLKEEYIFVDEITRAKSFIGKGYLISDILDSTNKSIMITGTDSLSIILASRSSLNHRMIAYSTVPMTFSEAKEVLGIGYNEYVNMGGFTSELTNDEILEIPVENIVNTIANNFDYSEYSNLKLIKSVIRSIIFYIYYMIIVEKISNIKRLKFNRFGENTDEEEEEIIRSKIGIIDRFNSDQLSYVLEKCEDLRVVDELGNEVQNSKRLTKFYINSPAITMAYLNKFKGILHSLGKVCKNELPTQLKRYLFECVVLNEIYDLDVSFFEAEYEIDFIVYLNSGRKYIAVECKDVSSYDRLKRVESLTKNEAKCAYKLIVTTLDIDDKNKFLELQETDKTIEVVNILNFRKRINELLEELEEKE